MLLTASFVCKWHHWLTSTSCKKHLCQNRCHPSNRQRPRLQMPGWPSLLSLCISVSPQSIRRSHTSQQYHLEQKSSCHCLQNTKQKIWYQIFSLPPHLDQSCCLEEIKNQDASSVLRRQRCDRTGLWTDFLSAASKGKRLYFEGPSRKRFPAISWGQKLTGILLIQLWIKGTTFLA